jgi:AcrR family transcriptional regulator
VRTRSQIVRAAKRIFERDGYLGARIVDIAMSAKVAIGTFYGYFGSKEDVFRAVISEVTDDIWEAGRVPRETDPVLAIDNANRQFLRLYRKRVRLMAAIEQAATVDDEFRDVRREMRERMVGRVELSIRDLQQRGLADATLDARCAAAALISMVNNFAYTWLVIGEPFEEETVVETLRKLWTQAIGLEQPKLVADLVHHAEGRRS